MRFGWLVANPGGTEDQYLRLTFAEAMRQTLVYRQRYIQRWKRTAHIVHSIYSSAGGKASVVDLFPFAFPGGERTSAGLTYGDLKSWKETHDERVRTGNTNLVDPDSEVTVYQYD